MIIDARVLCFFFVLFFYTENLLSYIVEFIVMCETLNYDLPSCFMYIINSYVLK